MQATTYVGTLSDRVFPRTGVLRDVALIVSFALFTAVAAQIAIPMWPVPITGQTLAVLITGASLGSKRGVLSMLLYAAMGMAGLPVFAGAVSSITSGKAALWATGGSIWGGTSFLALTSGGYIVGFIVAAYVVGKLAEQGWDRNVWKTVAAMLIGEVIVYAFGLPWLYAVLAQKPSLGMDLAKTLEFGLWPFLVGDGIKLALAAGVLPSAWVLVNRRRTK